MKRTKVLLTVLIFVFTANISFAQLYEYNVDLNRTEGNTIQVELKCPVINKDFMVFVSDRSEGYGGFDLYYSKKINGQWSEPQNFGDKINTQYDEYRPIIIRYVQTYREMETDMMIFSSNRPGGLGGYDLYFVGTDKTRE